MPAISKLYEFIDKKQKNEGNELKKGTVLDFLLDRTAARMSTELIQSQFKNIWGSEITEDQMIQIMSGHEDELKKRREKYAEIFKSSNYLAIALDAILQLNDRCQNAKSDRDLVMLRSCLNSYLSFFIIKGDTQALIDNMKSKVSVEDVRKCIFDSLTEDSIKGNNINPDSIKDDLSALIRTTPEKNKKSDKIEKVEER